MSQTQEDKQQFFREKLQTEGADGFADGPRPWEHWDESGNQDDNRVWEGSAKRIYPKQPKKPGIGDRLLSGLAVIALGSMVVGIAGVYFSTPSTRQLAHSPVQPPPIVSSRKTTQPATKPTDTAAPMIAKLDDMFPPAAGIPPAPEQHQILLEPTMAAAPPESPGSIDKVAVETVITEAAVTTTVYTHQPSQAEPELVAEIETTAPPFTGDSDKHNEPAVAAADNVLSGQTDVVATEPVVVAQAEVEATEPPFIAWTDKPVNEPSPVEQIAQAVPVPAPAATEQAEDTVTEPTGMERAAEPESDAAVVALNTTGTTAAAEPEINKELETTTQVPVIPEAKTGNWVINLSSYTRKPTAERMLAVFRKKGVDGEVFTTTINDKPMHRIRVTGFESARSAKAEISTLEQTLNLEGAWVSRR
jgi:hypothetical protein